MGRRWELKKLKLLTRNNILTLFFIAFDVFKIGISIEIKSGQTRFSIIQNQTDKAYNNKKNAMMLMSRLQKPK